MNSSHRKKVSSCIFLSGHSIHLDCSNLIRAFSLTSLHCTDLFFFFSASYPVSLPPPSRSYPPSDCHPPYFPPFLLHFSLHRSLPLANLLSPLSLSPNLPQALDIPLQFMVTRPVANPSLKICLGKLSG